jgi:predicted site-specific integrase-resolvase
MADQTLSPSGSPAKIEVPAKAGSGKRAAVYTRVSTGDQHPETQLYDLRELSRRRRFEIVHEYTDTISGAKSKRPALDQLLADARRLRFDVVLVAAFDRVARNVRHFLEVLDFYGNRVLYKGMSRKKTPPATGGSKEIPSDIQPVH